MFVAPTPDSSGSGAGPTRRTSFHVAAEIGEQIHEKAVAAAKLEAEIVHLIRDGARHCGAKCASDIIAWITQVGGVSGTEARRLIRLSRMLEDLPRLEEAYDNGQISTDVTDQLARVTTPEREEMVIAEISELGGDKLARELRKLDRVYDNHGIAVTPKSPDAETCSFYWTETGMCKLDALLLPHHGEQIRRAIDAVVEVDWKQQTEAAEASGETLDSKQMMSHPVALLHLAQHYLAHDHTDDTHVLPTRFQTVISIEAERYQHVVEARQSGFGRGNGTVGFAQDGARLNSHQADELLCESHVTAILCDHGVPVTEAILSRGADARQVRAMWLRDQGCVFPGCGRTGFLKSHHVKFWSNGGQTEIDNMVLLCQRHHSQIHKPNWRLSFDLEDPPDSCADYHAGDEHPPPEALPGGGKARPAQQPKVRKARVFHFDTEITCAALRQAATDAA